VQLVQRRFAAASLRAVAAAHHSTFQFPRGCRTPFREPLQFIVIAVMSVMRASFPDTYGGYYVKINSWRVRGPSRHRHGERHQENPIGKRLSSYHDGRDAHEGHLRAYSRSGAPPDFVGSLTPST
jgi:hypothetical protein